jgi:perosamine synthetase
MIRPLAEIRLTAEEMKEIEHLLPDPDPPLADECGPILRVSQTRLDGNELAYLTECIRSNWISSAGAFVERFERRFADQVGAKFAVACSSGTASLHLALAGLGIGPGDEVIVPAFTMIATANAVRYTGARPVFVDADARDWNLDIARVEAAITERTRGIVPVHTYGLPADMDALRAIADRRGLFLLEDAAQAHGATVRGRPAGSLGDAAAFSFYANKIISTGEGGMVTTNDERLAAVVRTLRDHAFSTERHFWHSLAGFNYRMTNLQAAVGLAQAERLAEFVEIRRQNARLYAGELARVPGITLPPEREGAEGVYWMYGILVGEEFGCSRDELRRRLARRGIETRTFFVPLPIQPVYFRQWRGVRFPVAEDLGRRGLYVPSSSALAPADIARVAREIAAAAGPAR